VSCSYHNALVHHSSNKHANLAPQGFSIARAPLGILGCFLVAEGWMYSFVSLPMPIDINAWYIEWRSSYRIPNLHFPSSRHAFLTQSTKCPLQCIDSNVPLRSVHRPSVEHKLEDLGTAYLDQANKAGKTGLDSASGRLHRIAAGI